MQVAPRARTDEIEVSICFPTAIRGLMATAGAAACVLVVMELGRALWPPTLLTLFFGIIVFGGLSVGCSFVAGGLFAPNVRWSFTPGQVRIEAELFGRYEVHAFPKDAFGSIAVCEISGDSGEATFQLACILIEPARFGPLFARHRMPLPILAFVLSPARALTNPGYLLTTLHSPEFHSRASAESAIALLKA